MRSFLERHNVALQSAYRELPSLLKEHHGIEQTVLAGGYGYRQVMELIQNGADAILEAHEHDVPPVGGNRIHVMLRASSLYVANTGTPLSEEGAEALLGSHSSPKRGSQIGRFGLGFKSLLRLGGSIELFTRASGGIRFDPARCRDELSRNFNVTEAPALRLAWPLEESERDRDDVLRQLAWAETIVRVEVGTRETLGHLREEVQEFPAEFLLFFPVATSLVLDDGEKPPRELRIDPDGNNYVLHDGDQSSTWQIAKRNVTIADVSAVADATHIHARDSVPVAWAIPLEGKREAAGRFWAFFPTRTPTYLPGILNAPWKLNSDRNAIIGGEWNSALMAEAVCLIAETLPFLSTEEDPGRPLDAFPRQPERSDDDAAPLVKGLWEALLVAGAIPDAAGVRRTAGELWRHPLDEVGVAKQWQAVADSDHLSRFVHPSCLERQRSSRLNALAELFYDQGHQEEAIPGLRRCEAASWFGAVASTKTQDAIKVLHLAEAYESVCTQTEWNLVRPNLAIIPSSNDELMTAGTLVFAPSGVRMPGRETVASAVCSDAEAQRILTHVMKVKALDDNVWVSYLQGLLRVPSGPADAWNAGWRAFWAGIRLAPPTVRERFATANRPAIRVLCRDGEWVAAEAVLLPGALVSEDDTSGNQQVLVDSKMHDEDGAVLIDLGVCECPEGDTACRAIDSPQEWLSACRTTYKRTHQNSASLAYLEPDRFTMPNGWNFLPRLGGAPNARLTERWLARIAQGEFGEQIRFGHCTMSSYPKIDVPHLLPWFVFTHGELDIGGETVRLDAVVARRREPVLEKMPWWDRLSPALDRLAQLAVTHFPASADIQALWRALIMLLATPSAVENDSLQALWTGAARDGVIPDSIHVDAGEVPLSHVFVTGSPDLARRTRTAGHIVITLDGAALELWVGNGARDLSELIKPQWASAEGPAESLLSAVPELADVLQNDSREAMRCQMVSELKLKIDTAAEPVPCLMWEGTLLLDAVQLRQSSRAQHMSLILREVAGAGWLTCPPDEALRRLGDARLDQLRAEVSSGDTITERLLRAVGGRSEPLLEVLGELGDLDFIQTCDAHELAQLALAHLGPATLHSLKTTLEEEGLKPPARWNTSEARAFVATIGFPVMFAASSEARREPEEIISGPIKLPSLHDFQDEVLEGIRTLLAISAPRRRAVVSLPTGGGKTRVTVEAAVRLVLAPNGNRRTVLWAAQSDELCEQAVQAFRQVWINLGAQSTDLRIVRLWGGNKSPAIQETDKPLVVVASIQTLNSRMGTDRLAWGWKPGMVVVDECHHAIAPIYTTLLRWLEAEAPASGVPDGNGLPIVGLSATPFRADDEESQRLAKRFDNRWFPSDQEALHARLRAKGVLAEAEYEALQSGARLLDEEVRRLAALPEPWEGLNFENIIEAINQRLAGDAERNQLLVERIRRGGEGAILFFANSVQHAQEISARLNLAGISSAPINGSMPTVARRYFLDRFQRGEIRVLCNHSVLASGFDAPKTDMVFIARQVFSPVRYMQMVGRGLRGEKNGGTACCRIVTVVDNLGRFQDRHPYHYCQRYFCN
jgi:superfamily II DNA or RNA helicase